MTLQEKYDRIIGLIEEFVEFGEQDIPAVSYTHLRAHET